MSDVSELTLLSSENELSPARSGDGKTLLLVDGHSLAYRMYFALERTGMRTTDKRPTWAVYGFFNILLSLLKKLRPEAVVMSFDVGRVTFRNELYPDYKAHRDSMPDDMRLQMGAIREGVTLFGIPVFERAGYEADDVIGTLARRASREGFRVRILTGDQDAFQLVSDGDADGGVEVLLPPRLPREEMKIYDRQAVFDKWGVYPEQVVDFKALKGDTSDNIPGVPGIGDKTAAKLLADYGSLDALYERLADVSTAKLREKLETNREQAFLSQRLARIECEVPLESVDWEACHLSIPDVPALMTFLETQEFRAHIRQAAEWLPLFQESVAVSDALAERDARKARLEEAGLHPESGFLCVRHELVTTEDALTDLADAIRRAGVFAIDVETTGLDVHTAELAGIAVSIGDDFELYRRPAENILNLREYPASFPAIRRKAGADASETRQPIRSFYIPLRQAGLDLLAAEVLPEIRVLQMLGPLLHDEDIVKLVHNVKFEGNIFRRRGIPLGGLVFDTLIASYVEEPDRRHGLKSLCDELLGWPMAEIDTLIGSGRKSIPFSEVPVEKAAAYAVCDTWATWELARCFLSRLEERQWTLFYEIEMPLAHVLAGMEWTGVSLDTDYLAALGKTLDERLGVLEREIWELAGVEFNLNSPRQVGEVLFERLGLASTRKTKSKTAYSTDVKVLEQLALNHDIARKLLDYRQAFKLKSTYIDALPTLVNPATGRLHTSFNQAVTVTGRLSSSNPNLQNIPIRSDVGRRIREAFVPENREDWVLISADYSQIELRLLAHFSEDPHLVEAFNRNEDIHTATASLVFGVPMDRVTKQQRYQAKTVNFGVIYGQSPYGLSQQLKIPQGEAAQFIRLYFSRYSRVEQCIEGIKKQARETGKVETLAGRIRDLSKDLASSNRNVREFAERAAFNTPLQGSAADLMKIAMIRLQRKLRDESMQSRIILQVHDELVLEAPRTEADRAEQALCWAMELDQPLRVPLVVDVHVGPSWME